ncbi:MAG TPA: hypothetical protein VGE74_11475 [Gemmata sp.]
MPAEWAARPLGCFADAAPPLILLPLAVSLAAAGFLFAVGAVAGGIWTARRLLRYRAAGAGRWTLRALGGAACAAALFSGLVGCLELAAGWLVAALLFVSAGVALLWAAERGGRPPTPPVDPPTGAPGTSG